MRMRKTTWAQSIAGFAVGLGVGVALGVLFAPMSGEDLRNYVSDSADDAIGGAADQARRLTRRAKDAAIDTIGRATDRLTDAADAGAKAYEQARKASA
jgi:gas vesicle protein